MRTRRLLRSLWFWSGVAANVLVLLMLVSAFRAYHGRQPWERATLALVAAWVWIQWSVCAQRLDAIEKQFGWEAVSAALRLTRPVFYVVSWFG